MRLRSLPESHWKEWNLRVSASPRAARGAHLFAGVFAGFEGFERTTENRGVPGSSPGLAIRFDPSLRALQLDPALRFHTRPQALRVRIAPQHPGASSATMPGSPWDVIRAVARIATHGSS